MFCDDTHQKIANYILLSFLCSVFVISATSDAAEIQGDYEVEGTQGKTGDTNHIDFSHWTTMKRHIREERSVPTIHPQKQARNSMGEDPFGSYCVLALHFIVLLVILVYIYRYIRRFIKEFMKEYRKEFQMDSSISSDRLTTVHRSSENSDLFPEFHSLPLRSNRLIVSRRQLCDEIARTDLLCELDRNRGATHASGVGILFIHTSRANYPQGSRESNNAVVEMPPDYVTVIMNDFTNPTKPDFPVVKRSCETPPPEYDKENAFF
ncbi:unnamed protein product [Larinioides sclopetarius]|uniref:Uncharacterized protein n=1 Tax=Larinioides sclopetarius TaxID=280406 RepID=A0AAV2BSJ9_9ARAC